MTAAISTDISHRQRLMWQCRRGMLELDILLQGFVEQRYDGLSIADQHNFEKLLKYPDQQLIEYFLQQTEPDDKEIACLVESIREAVTV
jgi:antitoxin CptB